MFPQNNSLKWIGSRRPRPNGEVTVGRRDTLTATQLDGLMFGELVCIGRAYSRQLRGGVLGLAEEIDSLNWPHILVTSTIWKA